MGAIRGDEHLSRCNGWAAAMTKRADMHAVRAGFIAASIALGDYEDTPEARESCWAESRTAKRLRARAERLADLCATAVMESGEGS